ncbi:cupin domain-containing protein [Hyphomicrobium sp. 99]|uniref:cupin domain-containing protein n=1 Tax=Hyphomicrobium sp. 99 TaxID=1163419 RepID=UPI0005F85A7C|nr:cupin domain-containing protein [Hyphomicrobium sp. 99]
MISKALMAAALIAFTSSAFAEEATHHAKELTPADVKFEDNAAFPKGIRTVVLYGDPSKPGLFILRVKLPPHSVIAPHTHPVFESVSIITGAMGSGMGEKVDKSKGKVLEAGALLLLPANHAHYVWSEDQETILQVAAIGPFDLTYINPKDDPRKK